MAPKKGYRHTPEAREKIRLAGLGRHFSPETREKIRQAHRGKSRPTPSPETIAKRTESMRRRWADPIYKARMSIALSGRSPSPETRRKIRDAQIGKPKHAGFSEKARRHRLTQRLPTKMTSIEIALMAEFRRRRLKFEMHKPMFGRWQPDFVFGQARLIVEADGDYWHRILKKNHQPLADAAKLAEWTVWRFAESEIRMHPAACGKAVAAYIKAHRT